MLTALSMSSMDMNIIMIFLLARNPKTPTEKRAALSTIYQYNGTII
jgi:hypothetical protein